MIEKTEVGDHLPDNGRVLVTLRNGKVSAIRLAHEDEHLASLKSLFELAKLSGFSIVEKDKSKVYLIYRTEHPITCISEQLLR